MAGGYLTQEGVPATDRCMKRRSAREAVRMGPNREPCRPKQHDIG